MNALATIEKERDESRKELERERIAKESIRSCYRAATEITDEERELREKAEKERDQVEYDSEYYATQLKEYID